ncbi:hypothetical protein [Fibrella musci]|uniref:hypothetical protein n=1 Tax=Fibrella musci TaxID=3242485 RepID=UPI003521C812
MLRHCLLLSCLLMLPVGAVAQAWAPYTALPDLYPSMALAMTHFVNDPAEDHSHDLGDLNGLLGISIQVPRRNTRVQLTLTCTGGLPLFDSVTIEVTVPRAKEEYIITPTIPFDQTRLASIRQVQTVFITYAVTIDGKAQPPRTEPLRVQSVNVCPFGVRDDDGQYTSFAFLFAAYVNEDHPQLDRILQEALQKKYVDAFVGYQGDPADVYRQVLAIWRVLQDRGFRYSNSTTTVADHEQVASQHVRLVGESLTHTQANCTDGSVLLASVLRKIGIEPILVTIPGHMFVGFDLDDESSEQTYLETTLLNAPASSATAAPDELTQLLLPNVPSPADHAAVDRFVAAVQTGNQLFVDNRLAIESGKADYSATPIVEARMAGVMPIPSIDRLPSAK